MDGVLVYGMAMTPAPKIGPHLSSHLYIRVEDDLRAALCSAAEREGMRLSDLARLKLREAVTPGRPAAVGPNNYFRPEGS